MSPFPPPAHYSPHSCRQQRHAFSALHLCHHHYPLSYYSRLSPAPFGVSAFCHSCFSCVVPWRTSSPSAGYALPKSSYFLKSCHITSVAASFLHQVEYLVSFARGSPVDMEGLRVKCGLSIGRRAVVSFKIWPQQDDWFCPLKHRRHHPKFQQELFACRSCN